MEYCKQGGTIIAIALCLAACAKSFDMSGERLMPLEPHQGIVIGSVVVKPVGDNSKSGDAVEASSFASAQSNTC